MKLSLLFLALVAISGCALDPDVAVTFSADEQPQELRSTSAALESGDESRNIQFEMIKNEIQKLSSMDDAVGTAPTASPPPKKP